MALTSIDELFGGPWGIVESRRGEIESGAYGALDRIYQQEVAVNFLAIGMAAAVLGCHESTARKRLREADARFIERDQAHLYYRPDVESLKQKRIDKRQAAIAKPDAA